MQCLIGCFKSHIQQAQNSMYMYIMIVFMFLIGCLTLYSDFYQISWWQCSWLWPISRTVEIFCCTMTEESNWQITQIWENYVFRLDLAYSTCIPSLEQKHSSCWKIFKSRHPDIALMSVYMTDTFCSFTRNVIFISCFLFSLYGSILVPKSC